MNRMQRLFIFTSLLLVLLFFSSAFIAGASAESSNDPVTGLPIYPGVADPSPMPKTTLCGKAVEGDFYLVMGQKTDVVLDWYAKHLSGFKKYHALVDNRSQDTFWNSDGTQQVTITGSPHSTEVFAISYGRVKPGLSASEIASFNTGKQICK